MCLQRLLKEKLFHWKIDGINVCKSTFLVLFVFFLVPVIIAGFGLWSTIFSRRLQSVVIVDVTVILLFSVCTFQETFNVYVCAQPDKIWWLNSVFVHSHFFFCSFEFSIYTLSAPHINQIKNGRGKNIDTKKWYCKRNRIEEIYRNITIKLCASAKEIKMNL